ncbi:hypothetical protein AT248_05900 [Bartonella henselae]|nr:hypothetical protein BhenCHDE101_06190 [Bartonella henselae]ETS08322.1 hypothetical protein Q654_01196 [Bartonella henselae JK 50]ETS08871.1 hypothetical protein Q655_01150 [Bartonella henselae JK 51]ETS15426.1 hypothetical protein Q652_00476 [Bartonella henselae JK 41]KEC57309.1 hypothetical protein O97_01127 [Bartonella henselae str. Zeus]KEC59511.1 hypothetical protein O95_01216 [Bartonella henselae JK 53]PNM38810.1 hypothetical protein AL470_005440 [Bartonella henselae str. Houston-1]
MNNFVTHEKIAFIMYFLISSDILRKMEFRKIDISHWSFISVGLFCIVDKKERFLFKRSFQKIKQLFTMVEF